MQVATPPHDEVERIASLRALDVLDTAHEERFDRLTRVARRLFDAPIVLVSLVDTNRQWFKSCVGLDVSETPRDVSFCAHAILQDDVFVIPDALVDERFHDNPLVTGDPHIRFYAGCPLSLPDGSRVGTLCIIDRVSREFTADDHDLLCDIAAMAERELGGLQDAITDELTGISNLDGFTMLGAHTLRVCNRLGRPLSMLCFDLCGPQFTGHAADVPAPDCHQDEAILTFGRILVHTFPDSDVIGRLGHSRFGVLMSKPGAGGFASDLQRLRQAVEQHNATGPGAPHLAYASHSAIGDPSYELEFDLLFSAACCVVGNESGDVDGDLDGDLSG